MISRVYFVYLGIMLDLLHVPFLLMNPLIFCFAISIYIDVDHQENIYQDEVPY